VDAAKRAATLSLGVSPVTEMDVVIRSAQVGDEGAIADIHVLAWQAAYKEFMSEEYLSSLSVQKRAERWRETLSNPGNGKYLVATTGGIIRGFAVYGPARDEDLDNSSSELVALIVHPESWRRKIGYSLVGAILDKTSLEKYSSIYLWVIKGNNPAIKLYESFGFQDTGISKTEDIHSGHPLHELRYSKMLG